MIPFKVDETTREDYVRNIVAAYRAATAAQRARGEAWYQVAHDIAVMVADGNAREGAGVLAALSANKSWRDNRKLAERAYGPDGPGGHTTANVRKVERIMLGEDPEDVLPMHAKTGHFFRCILDPTDPDPVVIDRHAHDIAVGVTYGDRERGLSSKKRYALLAHCYREAALRIGEVPSIVQAVTWVRHTQLIAGTSTRNDQHAMKEVRFEYPEGVRVYRVPDSAEISEDDAEADAESASMSAGTYPYDVE